VDIASSVSISLLKSVSPWLSWADATRVNDSAHGRNVCEYANPHGKLMIWVRSAVELLPIWAGGVLGRGGGLGGGSFSGSRGMGSGVCYLH